MVVVLAFVQLVHRLATLEIAAQQNSPLLKCGSTRYTVAKPMSERSSNSTRNTSSAVMWRSALWKNFQNFQARQGGLEAGAFKFVDIGHGKGKSSAPGLRMPAATMDRIIAPFYSPCFALARCSAPVALVVFWRRLERLQQRRFIWA